MQTTLHQKNPDLKKNVRDSIHDVSLYGLMVGMGENYFCAFMLALGISEVMAGLGHALPLFVGALIQLINLHPRIGKLSLKKRTLFFVAIQGACFLPLAYFAHFRINSPYLVFLFISFYWGSGLSASPTWSTWMAHLIPTRFRTKFFSERSKYSQFYLFIGLIGAGITLQSVPSDLTLTVFSLLFLTAFFMRVLSLKRLQGHPDLAEFDNISENKGILNFIHRLKTHDDGRTLFFMFVFGIGVHLASPFFGPFMLKQLHLNYIEYMALLAASFGGKIFSLHIMNRNLKSCQLDKLLVASSIGIVVLPVLWAFHYSYPYLVLIQFISGMFWAANELSTLLILYKTIPQSERTAILTYNSVLSVMGMLIGSGIGASILHLSEQQFWGYQVIFMLSAACRFLAVILIPTLAFNKKRPIGLVFSFIHRPFINSTIFFRERHFDKKPTTHPFPSPSTGKTAEQEIERQAS